MNNPIDTSWTNHQTTQKSSKACSWNHDSPTSLSIPRRFALLRLRPGEVLQGYWQGHDFRDRNGTAEKCRNMEDPYYPMADRDPETLKEKDVDADAWTEKKVLSWLRTDVDELYENI